MKTDNRKARSMMLRVLARLAYEINSTPEDLTAALGFDVADSWARAEAEGYISNGSVTEAGARYLDHVLIHRPGRPSRIDEDELAFLRSEGLGGRTMKDWARCLGVSPSALRRALYGGEHGG